MKRIMVLGMGPGHPDYRIKKVEQYIQEADVLVLSKRLEREFQFLEKPKYVISGQLNALFEELELCDGENIAFLLSGDVSLYSLLPRIQERFSPKEWVVEPGISSVQYLFSRWGKDYRNMKVISAHGREFPYGELKGHHGIFAILTDQIYSPKKVLELLMELGYGEREAIVGTDLSYEEEQILAGKVKELLEKEWNRFGVVMVDGIS